MAAAKKLTKRQISKEVESAARDYENLCQALHKQCLWNVASRLKMAPEELEEEWACLT